MADGIRGKHFEHLPEDVQKGVILHRAIDTYTDAHPIFRESTKRLHEQYHHYAGVIVDVFYDHFLAKNWNKYHDQDLEGFAQRFYKSLHDNHYCLTDRTKNMLPYMEQHNWLVTYRTVEGIERILTQMDRRTKTDSRMGLSVSELRNSYDLFEKEFTEFFEDLRTYSAQKLITL